MIQLMFLKVHPCCLLFSFPFLNSLVQTPLDRDEQGQLLHGVWNRISDSKSGTEHFHVDDESDGWQLPGMKCQSQSWRRKGFPQRFADAQPRF